MDNFPIFLDIKNKPILVVGGGEIALRKVFLLNKAAPKITVVAKSFSKDLLGLTMNNKNIHLIKRDFKNSDIDQAQLIIAATDNLKLNQKISKLAQIGRAHV